MRSVLGRVKLNLSHFGRLGWLGAQAAPLQLVEGAQAWWQRVLLGSSCLASNLDLEGVSVDLLALELVEEAVLICILKLLFVDLTQNGKLLA